MDRENVEFSRYIRFTREDWARLRADTPLTLSESELTELRGINERVSIDEVVDIYLPLARLLNLYIAAVQQLFRASSEFLGKPAAKVPYVIGLAGSVAVGKSTTARILQALLSRAPEHPRVELVPTDGFLYPNRVLAERGLMHRKGFPESYDLSRLIQFLSDIKSGRPHVRAPVYGHLEYDIVPERHIDINQPDVVIIEGLNILQSAVAPARAHSRVFVSDFFDFSMYAHAEEEVIRQWYIERFLMLRETAFRSPSSYFHRYADLSDPEARRAAQQLWESINSVNLRENILPTRRRANLILVKGNDHSVQAVELRKL